MKLRKIFISIVLLFSYGLGFAHNLVPHSHEEEDHHERCHQPVVVADHHDDHSHISHQGHIDEGFWGFMMCILVDLDHNEANLQFMMLKNLNWSAEPLQIALHLTELIKIPEGSSIIPVLSMSYFDPGDAHYSSPVVDHPVLRGPPFIA